MTHKEEKAIIKALKALKNIPEAGWPDFDTSERMKKRVMEYVGVQGGAFPRPVYYLGFFAILRMAQYLFSARFVYAAGIFALFVGVASAAVGSRNALPGETLYGTKLAVDEAKVRFTSNPASRARVQMEIAGNRLRELEKVLPIAGDITGNQESQRTEEVLRHFSKDIKRAQESLKQAGDPLQVKQAKAELAKKAREYEKKLIDVKVKPGREVGIAVLAEAEEALKGVQQDSDSAGELENGEVGI
ncbi:hypothetical protein HYW17_01445 [Candidatus Uhrbacteria bacterium]|nr:hypothetical protein [Candidatus Uhrbacteria bacterium]